MDSEEPNAAALPIDQELLSIMGGEDEIRLLDERFKHAQLHLQDLKAKGEEAFDDAKALWTKEIDMYVPTSIHALKSIKAICIPN